MTYTLAMPADQRIEIAKDGVAEVAMTHARANLTQLLREVRYGKRPGAFTERGERSAYVVPPEFYEQAVRDHALLEELRRRGEEPGPDSTAHDRMRAETIRSALYSVELAVD